MSVAKKDSFMRSVVGRITRGDKVYHVLECGHETVAPAGPNHRHRPVKRTKCAACAARPVGARASGRPRVCRACGAKLCSMNRGSLCFAHQPGFGDG